MKKSFFTYIRTSALLLQLIVAGGATAASMDSIPDNKGQVKGNTIFKAAGNVSSNFTFTHYVGDVYNGKNMSDLPADLQYKTAYKTHDDDPLINSDADRIQRAHEYTRDVYIFPGKTYELLPFSDFKTKYQYNETYVRWFDYRTGKKSNQLAYNSSETVYTTDYGTFGGSMLYNGTGNSNPHYNSTYQNARKNGTSAIYTAPNSYTNENGIMDVIAIDISASFTASGFTKQTTSNWGNSTTSLVSVTEPNLFFRNKFIIRDAKKRADEMTDCTAAKNQEYVEKHATKLMCPAGTPFQYPLPSYESTLFTSSATPTDYWYKKSDGNYAQVYHYLIKMQRYNESTGLYEDYGRSVNMGGTLTKNPTTNDCQYVAIAFKASDNLAHHLYIAQPQEGKYKIYFVAIENSSTFSTSSNAVACSGRTNKSLQTTYTTIKLKDNTNDLLLAEYDLEVLPVSKGNMVTESTLNSNDTYQYQRPAKMKELYGEPTVEVNFDDIADADMTTTTSGNYYKWPWKWESSSYGFGYTERYDYNTYVVLDNVNIISFSYASQSTGNIYDRLYKETNGAKKGKMFFANAAGEPGRMALLDVGKKFCTGTKVYVSAWVMETNYNNETANVVFSFRGVKNGTEEILNSFVSGYVLGGDNTATGYSGSSNYKNVLGDRGQWMHVYWEFDTDVASADYDQFIIVLENNASNSNGADYVIDDIQCYVRQPILYAQQETPVCNGSCSTPLKVYGNYEQLLGAFGLQETTIQTKDESRKFYYVFLDKEKYDTAMQTAATNEGYTSADVWKSAAKSSYDTNDKYWAAYKAAFDDALIKNTYGTNANANYGELTLHTYYQNNDSIDTGVTGGIRNVYFSNVNATDLKMQVSKSYYVTMLDSKALPSGLTEPDASAFLICDACHAVSEFEVIFSGQVKIDGVLDSEMDGESYCANQIPTISIDLKGIEDGEVQTYSGTSVTYDWFMGPYKLDSYYNQKPASDYGYTEADCYMTAMKGIVSLLDAQKAFRDTYPTATTQELKNGKLSNGTAIVASTSTGLTAEMIAYLQELANAGKMYFYESSQDMSTMDQYGQQHKQVVYSTAIPLKPATATANTKFCLEPIQIAIAINDRAPQMKDGDDSGNIHYPSSLTNVPLRIGLAQLKRCVMADLDAVKSDNDLYIPLRDLKTVTKNVTKFSVGKWQKNKTATATTTDDDFIYLADSNDPNVADGESGAVTIENSDLYCIGKLRSITADANATGNIFHLAFIKAFNFREGYWYKLKFHFQEVYSGTGTDAHDDVCPGDVVFTIKVVPEYEKWTGAVSRNWNDDGNWSRVSSSELLASSTDATLTDYITDGGTNDTKTGYVPADFTKVIIPADAKRTPYLYNIREESNLQEVNFTGATSASNYIKKTRPADDEAAKIGYATDLIKYDMSSAVAEDKGSSGEANVACRAWYDHTCEQIHFNSGAEIMEQEYLNYEKAWWDVEMEPGKWHNVSSPLQGVVAGDLYLPTAGARQNTRLFQDINYTTTLNDRFKPAVYQRSWNKGAATVYKLDGTTDNSAVSLDWSHVYNDVQVNYGAGNGFSIKADVSTLDESSRPEKVKFRLPKADKTYTYYNPGNTDGDKTTQTISTAERTGKLADLSQELTLTSGEASASTTTKYFLVGNPLVCSMNMTKFFEKNTQFKKKYWLTGQRTAVMDETSGNFISSDAIENNTQDANYVAPGVSFFVELADEQAEATTTTATITSDMMTYGQAETEKQNNVDVAGVVVEENDPNPNNEAVTTENSSTPARRYAKSKNASKAETAEATASQSYPMLSILATTGDGRKSSAVLTDGTAVKHAGGEMLMDSNLAADNGIFVYAAVDGKAMSVGSINKGDTIPVAVVGEAESTTITIRGVEDFEYPIWLLDAETGEKTQLTGETTVDATQSGVRYYLATENTKVDVQQTAIPRVEVEGCTVTAYAPAGDSITQMSVYGTDGTLYSRAEDITTSHSVTVAPGIYLVELSTATWHHTYKFLLK